MHFSHVGNLQYISVALRIFILFGLLKSHDSENFISLPRFGVQSIVLAAIREIFRSRNLLVLHTQCLRFRGSQHPAEWPDIG